MTPSDWTAGGAVVVAVFSAVMAARNSSRATAITGEMTEVERDKAEIERARELRADASEARADARAARADAAAAMRASMEAHRRADLVVDYLGWILRLIHDPTTDMETLRRNVRDSAPPVSVGADPRRDNNR